MALESGSTLFIAVCTSLDDASLERIRAVDPGLRVTDVAYPLWRELPATLRVGQWEPRPRAEAKDLNGVLAQAEVILAPRALPRDFRARCPKLRWMQLTRAGFEWLRHTDLWESDVLITGGNAITALPVAEFTVAAMLMLAKEAPRLFRNQQGRRWDRFNLLELRGKTVGILGLGAIGREVARLCKAFGMEVMATKRTLRPGDEVPHVDRLLSREKMGTLLQECDFLVLSLPLVPETVGLMGEAELRAMKPTAFLMNMARGEIVQEEALVRALEEGWIAGAALDVFSQEPMPPESPLWRLPNVIISPHIAALSDLYDVRAAELFCENLRRYLVGDPLLYVIEWKRGY